MKRAHRFSDGLFAVVSADRLQCVIPFEHFVIAGLQMFDRDILAPAARDHLIPIALLVGDNEIEHMTEDIVFAEQRRVEFGSESNFFEHLFHRLAQQNVQEREHAEQEAGIGGEIGTFDLVGDQLAELCAQK